MENKEIQELCNQIKDKLNELGFTEFTLYAADYYGDHDDDELIEQIEEKVPDTASSLGWYFKVNDDYSGYSSVHTYARKIKIKGNELVFDLEDIYEDNDGGWEDKGYHEDQTISEILDKCPEEMVMSGLKEILHYAFNCDTYDVIGSNKL
jgi:hypothetical protein